jgi:hypothetical protein
VKIGFKAAHGAILLDQSSGNDPWVTTGGVDADGQLRVHD